MSVFNRKHQTGAVDLTEPLQTRLLWHRLKRIDQVEADLPPPASDHSYKNQEIETLRAELQALRRVTTNQLALARTPPDLKEAARTEATLDQLEAEKTDLKHAFLQRLMDQGDYRQWRIHYRTLVDLREQLSGQYSLKE